MELEDACPGAHHVLLSAWTDGGKPWLRSKLSFWPVLGRDMNSPEDQRNKRLMLWCLCAGKPANFETYLAPLFASLRELQSGWTTSDGTLVNAGLSFFSGDGPACAALLCTQGHSGEFNCYRCYFQGRKAAHSNDGYYFLGHANNNRLEMRSPPSCEADHRNANGRILGAPSRSGRVEAHRGTKGRPGLTDVILGGDPYESTLHDGAHAIKNFCMMTFQLLLGLKRPNRPAPLTMPSQWT